MSKSTPGTAHLTRLGAIFTLHVYDYAPGAERVGLQAADALGEPASRVLKTLMLEIDGKPACAVLPSDRELNLKKVASALGGKTAKMMLPATAERLTGYKVGGISPFGQKKAAPTLVEASALLEPYVFMNGGQRGLQVRMAPNDAVQAMGAVTAEIVA